MLVCPKCQFENPNTNKFCQSCGTSLIHKTCHECEAQVPVTAETCHNCGAFTGTVWRAIFSKDPNFLISGKDEQAAPLEVSDPIATDTDPAEELPIEVPLADQDERPQPGTLATTPVPSSESALPPLEDDREDDTVPFTTAEDLEAIAEEEVTQPLSTQLQSKFTEGTANGTSEQGDVCSPTPTVVYLDNQQRYRLIEPESLNWAATDAEPGYGLSVRVLDCQPFQKSPLEALLEQQQGGSETFDIRLRSAPTSPTDPWNVRGIPGIAQPYLALKASYYQTLPAVHDAWQQAGEAVVLLEDRSGWQLLRELWDSEQLSTLQILYWLDEMAKLWQALEPWHCRQSLLETTNLRVDEDQALGLVRLYPDPTEQPLTLQNLGQMWQRLFDQSQRTQYMSLAGLFQQMCTQEIGTIHELRSRLESIARQHEAMTSQFNPNPNSDDAESADSLVADTPAETGRTQLPRIPHEAMSSNEGDELPTLILPMQLLSLDDAGCTDIGHQREHNEDSFGIQTLIQKVENPMGRSVQARGLYILCDGMGGHASGEVASGMAVEAIRRYFQEHWQDEQLPSEEIVREGVRIANQAIYEVNEKNARSGSGRMGTTLVMMLIQNTNVAIAHVGDSRLYRLTRKRGLEQLTVDHEVAQREIIRGVDPEIAFKRPDANQLTQALGPRGEQFVNPDVQILELNEDTLFIMCSDGLSDNDLVETHWQTHLAPLLSSRANLDQGILQLIELANDHNGHDNITAILIRVKVRPNFEQQQLLYK
jgi:serine/threonine protein phosphatase PrpC